MFGIKGLGSNASVPGSTVTAPMSNLIGAFFQPSLVLIDTSFLKTLPKREMICGYAEILKHSLIKDLKFFNWLKLNTKKIINKDSKALIYSIYKS